MKFPFSDIYQSFMPQATTPLLSAWYKGLNISQEKEEDSVSACAITYEQVVTGNMRQIPALTPIMQETTAGEFQLLDEDFPPLPPQAPVLPQAPAHQADDNTHRMVTRGKAGVRKPNPRYVMHTIKTDVSLPKNLSEALKHPGWNAVMVDEYDTCQETNTWSLVPCPPNTHVIGCGWIHKVKLNADGTFGKHRSRLVARGNEQTEGIDFLETYNPVVRTATVRMVLHIATVNRWDIRQFDVKNAFLHGDLTETIYMKQPPGFEDPAHPNHVCLLHKAIYGLK